MDLQTIKRTFGIIGNDPQLERAIEVATKVASTDLTVLITGESGTGKDVFPRIIHQYSNRKHGPYFAINCGAIPEGTIDSELFGHEKGSFTGAIADRKGYFETADKGTLFLDEVGELPLSTQARLLRVLENGEFIKVGGSKVMKTDVRVVAATNLNLSEAIQKGKFREDLYYRLNTIPIHIPALRERKEDIHLLFRKFVSDFAEHNRIPTLNLTPDAVKVLENYRWEGNIRQLKNVTEQICIMETQRTIDASTLERYLPVNKNLNLPVLLHQAGETEGMSERDILYKVLFEMKQDINDLRSVVSKLSNGQHVEHVSFVQTPLDAPVAHIGNTVVTRVNKDDNEDDEQAFEEVITPEEPQQKELGTLSLEHHEKEMIIRALERFNGKRKDAAAELGISERTLYRKIKEYDIKL